MLAISETESNSHSTPHELRPGPREKEEGRETGSTDVGPQEASQ